MLAVIIPVYNEEKTLAQTVEQVMKIEAVTQIVIVDDGSSDRTFQVMQELGERHSLISTVRHEKNQGKGAAVRTGLEQVKQDMVIIQDADLEYHPEDYPAALRLIEKGWADAVYGSRFLGSHRAFLYWHYLANKFLTLLVNITSDANLTDIETGFKMFRTDILRNLELKSSQFDIEVEITIKLFRHRYRVYEIPITYTGRSYAEGKKITWRDGFHALYAIARWSLYKPG